GRGGREGGGGGGGGGAGGGGARARLGGGDRARGRPGRLVGAAGAAGSLPPVTRPAGGGRRRLRVGPAAPGALVPRLPGPRPAGRPRGARLFARSHPAYPSRFWIGGGDAGAGWLLVSLQIVAVITLAAPTAPWLTGDDGSDSAAATSLHVLPCSTAGL